MGDSNSENGQKSPGTLSPAQSAVRFFKEVVIPLAKQPRADVYCMAHFIPPHNEPAPQSSPIQDGEKDENRIYVIYYPPELTRGPTGHMALMYKGRAIDLYPENIDLDHGGLSAKLAVCVNGYSKRKRDTKDGTLHGGFNENTRVVAISPNQLKSFYKKILHLSEKDAQERFGGIEQRISDIRGDPNKESGWHDWRVMGSEKSGNCTDGVRYVLGLPRAGSTFLNRKKGLALPSNMYKVLVAMVNAGYGNLVTPEYYTNVKFAQNKPKAESQDLTTQIAALRASSTR